MISYQTSRKNSKSIARARIVVRIVRVFLLKTQQFVIEVGWGGGRFRQNHFPITLIVMMMSSVLEPGTTGSGGHLVNSFLLVTVAMAASVVKALRLI